MESTRLGESAHRMAKPANGLSAERTHRREYHFPVCVLNAEISRKLVSGG